MQDARIAELDEVAARAAGAVARDEVTDAAVPAFLLRRYLDAGGDGLQEALGVALARSLALAADADTVADRAAWLTLLVEATAVAADDRILPAAERLIAALRATWPEMTRIDDVCLSVEACLRAAEIGGADPPVSLVQEAIDHLERVIGGSYRPGDGLVRERGGVRVRCGAGDHVRGAAALLTAFEVTGRLPYSMLAEELMAIVLRDPSAGALELPCETARVLCRLAALHDDPGYRGAAVIATGADYRAAASRILAGESAHARAGSPSDFAAYGLALGDLLRHVR